MNEISFRQGSATDVLERLDVDDDWSWNNTAISDAPEPDLVMLAQLDDAVVGYLAASTDHRGAMVVWEHIVVPKFRDRGIGRRLLLEAARRTPPMAQITIDPTGEFAIGEVAAYYSRLGFPSTPNDQSKVSVPAHQVVDKIGERLEEDMPLEGILRRKPIAVVTIAPDATITEAVALMSDLHIGSVVVSPDDATIAGVLSERNIVAGLHRRGAAVLDSAVSELMTTDVVSVEVTDVVSEVMEIATVKRLRHLPVTDEGSLVGLVSVGDLLVFRMREHDMQRDRLPYRDR